MVMWLVAERWHIKTSLPRFQSPGIISPMPRTSYSGPRQTCSTAADLRAQRRRARVIDDGCRIILSHPPTSPEVITPRPPQHLDSDRVEYLDFSHEKWDGIVAPGRSRSSSVGTILSSIPGPGSLAENDDSNARSLPPKPSRLEPLFENSPSPNAGASPEQKHVRDRDQAPLDHTRGGRWVLDSKTGFEMYVPPSSPRRPLRPRMRSMPAPEHCAGAIRPLPQVPKRITLPTLNENESGGAAPQRQRRALVPQPPLPMPPSLAQFWESDSHPPPAHEPGPASPVAARHTPLLGPVTEREHQFLNLLARDCGSGILLQEIAATPTTGTHRSNASKTSSRKSGGITGKLSSGLSAGIPSFFRARRNTTAGQASKQCETAVPSY